MKKPGYRGSRYKPRGQTYVPRRRPSEAPLGQVAAVGGPDSIFSIAAPFASSNTPQSSATVSVGAEATPAFDRVSAPVFRWQPRESVVIPVLLTIAALAVMQRYPAHHLNESAVVPVIFESQSVLKDAVARVALLPSENIDALASSGPPLAAAERAPPVAEGSAASEIAVRDVGHLGAVPLVRACEVPNDPVASIPSASIPPAQFGSALAAAAEAQTREFVVYDDEYRVIRYPGGDVATLYGVCTDVIIRAYRALGIDLQRLVHESQVGSGDTNISHRRTEALRRFFKKVGASVAITDFAEDYLAGDVITYHRPQNSSSTDHIAIVSNVTGPSGRLMIVHNRGFGPQVEDALFVNDMTGHFRYFGPAAGDASRSVGPNVKAEKRSVHVTERTPRRISNSVLRKIRRAASLRASNGAGAGKAAPKL